MFAFDIQFKTEKFLCSHSDLNFDIAEHNFLKYY